MAHVGCSADTLSPMPGPTAVLARKGPDCRAPCGGASMGKGTGDHKAKTAPATKAGTGLGASTGVRPLAGGRAAPSLVLRRIPSLSAALKTQRTAAPACPVHKATESSTIPQLAVAGPNAPRLVAVNHPRSSRSAGTALHSAVTAGSDAVAALAPAAAIMPSSPWNMGPVVSAFNSPTPTLASLSDSGDDDGEIMVRAGPPPPTACPR